MEHGVLIAVLLCLAFSASYAADCCGSYTDASGTHHDAELCEDYCCIKIDLDLLLHGAYKECCSDASRQIPASKNENEDCVRDWLHDNIWAPIVGGIVFLIILIALCTCCCCCGCCACCRKTPGHVIVQSGPVGPTTAVTMSNTTMVNQNPAHAGYNQ